MKGIPISYIPCDSKVHAGYNSVKKENIGKSTFERQEPPTARTRDQKECEEKIAGIEVVLEKKADEEDLTSMSKS